MQRTSSNEEGFAYPPASTRKTSGGRPPPAARREEGSAAPARKLSLKPTSGAGFEASPLPLGPRGGSGSAAAAYEDAGPVDGSYVGLSAYLQASSAASEAAGGSEKSEKKRGVVHKTLHKLHLVRGDKLVKQDTDTSSVASSGLPPKRATNMRALMTKVGLGPRDTGSTPVSTMPSTPMMMAALNSDEDDALRSAMTHEELEMHEESASSSHGESGIPRSASRHVRRPSVETGVSSIGGMIPGGLSITTTNTASLGMDHQQLQQQKEHEFFSSTAPNSPLSAGVGRRPVGTTPVLGGESTPSTTSTTAVSNIELVKQAILVDATTLDAHLAKQPRGAAILAKTTQGATSGNAAHEVAALTLAAANKDRLKELKERMMKNEVEAALLLKRAEEARLATLAECKRMVEIVSRLDSEMDQASQRVRDKEAMHHRAHLALEAELDDHLTTKIDRNLKVKQKSIFALIDDSDARIRVISSSLNQNNFGFVDSAFHTMSEFLLLGVGTLVYFLTGFIMSGVKLTKSIFRSSAKPGPSKPGRAKHRAGTASSSSLLMAGGGGRGRRRGGSTGSEGHPNTSGSPTPSLQEVYAQSNSGSGSLRRTSSRRLNALSGNENGGSF